LKKFITYIFLFYTSIPLYLFPQNLITGSTTTGAYFINNPIPQIMLYDLVGSNEVNLQFVKLNGPLNSISIDVKGISTEFNLDTGGGDITADLQVFKLIVAAEGDENSRHFVGIEGSIGNHEVKFELDFEPGMSAITTGMVNSNIGNTPYKLIISDLTTNQTRVFENTGTSSNQQSSEDSPITFLTPIPNRVKLLYKVPVKFKVDLSKVSEYRFKLDVPGDWTGGIRYAIKKWSDWTTDIQQSIVYSSFEKEGTYKFTIQYKEKPGNKKRKFIKEFKVYWEYPEIRSAAFDIDYDYIDNAPDEKEQYRRAAEEYKKAHDIWMRKFEYEHKVLKLTGNTAKDIVLKIARTELEWGVEQSLKNILHNSKHLKHLQLSAKFGTIFTAATVYSIIKEGYKTVATVYRNAKANKAATMAIKSYILYQFYQNEIYNYQNEIPTRGLVAYYPFNGNAKDESGNFNHGKVNGAYLVNDRFGNDRKAYYFDGTGSTYINIGNKAKPSFPLTICAWIKLKNTDKNVEIFRNDINDGNSSYHGAAIQIVQNGRLQGIVGSGVASKSHRKSKRTFNKVIFDNTWQFITVVFYNYNNINLFVDGIEYDGDYRGGGKSMTYSSKDGMIGIGKTNGVRAVVGVIDDVRVYNRTLNHEEILSLFKE